MELVYNMQVLHITGFSFYSDTLTLKNVVLFQLVHVCNRVESFLNGQ